MNRRNFLLGVAATTSVSGGLAAGASAEPTICFFSKHLHNLGYDELGRTVKDAGFSGVDLTVRKGGHVLPERVREDLPRAGNAIRSHGLQVPKALTDLARKYGIVAGFHNHPRKWDWRSGVRTKSFASLIRSGSVTTTTPTTRLRKVRSKGGK